ncbi:Polypyrimidine tract-binding protein-like 1 [Vitis vinifera]|uniref:Polypyrimidine tract-binding protein-like 1 n=1 Tax=Vitis vinifera TaxID=29760 RepID=A0A438FIB0_VITVI|nr:Polypyrimidine tract-binding protein-like 1 [Vitis vinifera]
MGALWKQVISRKFEIEEGVVVYPRMLSQRFPHLYGMAAHRNGTVEDMWDQNVGQGDWDVRFVRGFNDWELDLVATWGKVLTLDRLQKRGWHLPNRCFLCGYEKETVNHILIHCIVARVLWDMICALVGVKWVFPETVKEHKFMNSGFYDVHLISMVLFIQSCRDYTNPYLPVNPTAIEGIAQPALGPDGKKKEPESNVLLASIENMQYAVTVDVLHTVFSAFGTVQKIAIFEKNGGMQALIQYPDVTTAAVAKEALEGHCIYDGGYCKLHLSYSRHTDLNVKAHSDRSRDYTIPDSGLLAVQQAPGHPGATTVWQNPQAAPLYTGHDAAAAAAVQVPSWDPNMQAAVPPNVRPGGASPPGRPPYFGLLVGDKQRWLYCLAMSQATSHKPNALEIAGSLNEKGGYHSTLRISHEISGVHAHIETATYLFLKGLCTFYWRLLDILYG